MPELICLGEALIDFISVESGVSLEEASGFNKAFGGATANVSVAASRLGRSSAFVGKVGDDPFGRFIERTLADNNVDTSRMHFDKSARTGLAFVSLKAGGVPDFMFYRNPSADMLLATDELDRAFISNTKIFHYGSISLISEPSRGATLDAAAIARQGGAITSYDPNLRLSLWDTPASAKHGMIGGLAGANIVKLSEEELLFMTGVSGLEDGVQALMALAESIELVFVTRGPNGAYYSTRTISGDSPGFDVTPVDTTGAGDSFVGAILSQVLERDLNIETIGELPKSELDLISRVANAMGALATTKRGAIASLPTYTDLQAFLRQSTP